MSSVYFQETTGKHPSRPAQIVRVKDVEVVSVLEGLAFQPILGESAMLSFVTFAPNTVAPPHAHEEEQFTIILEGECEAEVGGKTERLSPGAVLVIPPHVSHTVRSLNSTVREIDVFSPPRKALLDLMAAGGAGE
jgi:quercetin dioxygenase-like cupin family protein